jgi:hypothetical protein
MFRNYTFGNEGFVETVCLSHASFDEIAVYGAFKFSARCSKASLDVTVTLSFSGCPDKLNGKGAYTLT